jgi:hypothetical protein
LREPSMLLLRLLRSATQQQCIIERLAYSTHWRCRSTMHACCLMR